MTLVSSTEWPTNRLWSVPTGSDDDLLLSQAVTQKSRTLLLYSDVVNSNIVGDGLHPLVREVYYRGSSVGTMYFAPLHIQWLPLCRPYSDVIKVSSAESSGRLVAFEKARPLSPFNFVVVRRTYKIQRN